MGIKGLTERKLAFPEIGQIRKGAPKGDNGQLGRDLTYFRVEFDEREDAAAQVFKKVYGEQPQEINILFPFNDIDQVFSAYLEAYTAGRMVARSDGEKFIYLIDTKTGEIKVKNGVPFTAYKDGQAVGSYTDGKGKEQKIYCSAVGRLKVVIPELQRLAYMTVMTSSKHDIANLDAQMNALKQINNGQIAGIPMVLKRRPKKISTPKKDGSRARYTKWMLSIEADPNWVKAKLSEFKHLALPANGFPELQEEAIDVAFIEAGDIPGEDAEFDPPSDPEIDQEETNSDPEIRPYPAEKVKARIEFFANDTFKGKTASQAQKNLAIGMLEACFAEGDTSMKRHEVCKYLTGAASTKKISGPYILALLEWLKPEKDDGGAYQPSALSEKEAQNILRQFEEDAGQKELF